MMATCSAWNSRHGVAGEPVEIEHVRRVLVGGHIERRVDLAPVGVLLTPEHIPPGIVQRLEGAVFAFQPLPKRNHAGPAVRADRAVAAPFVVGLPANDSRMLPIAAGDLTGDAAGMLAVNRAGVVVMFARAEIANVPIGTGRQNFRMLADQPGRRRGRGGAHDDRESRIGQRFHRVIEPLPVEHTLGGFHFRPGELCYAHIGDTELLLPFRIVLPLLPGDVLGVVADAKREGFGNGRKRFDHQRGLLFSQRTTRARQVHPGGGMPQILPAKLSSISWNHRETYRIGVRIAFLIAR